MADTRLGPAEADSELAPASSFIGGDLALEGHGSALDVLGGPHQAHALTIGMLSDASANVKRYGQLMKSGHLCWRNLG
jgi:hypothetical protein